MSSHADLLAILFIVWGLLTALVGVSTLALAVGAVSIITTTTRGGGSQVAASLTAAAFTTLATIAILWGVAHVAIGVPLRRRRPWSRVVALLLGSVDLLLLPYGTALGIYALWVLLNEKGKALFEHAWPILELTEASVVLGRARVLDRLTLSIADGEHTAIIGPNGAGKSTLMRLLTLQLYPLDEPDRPPPVRVFGRARWDVFELRSQIGIVSPDLHDRLVSGNSSGMITGLDAVVSGFFATQGIAVHLQVTDEMRRLAAEALDTMGIAHLADVTLNEVSTGEARRVLIARALVHQPRLLVLDEPTRGLDLASRFHFMERVRRVARRGTTLLLVTHHIDEIVPEVERVLLLQGGRLAYDGPKAEALAASRLGPVFGAPLAVERADGYYHVRVVASR